jgi:phage anti-repressor protein
MTNEFIPINYEGEELTVSGRDLYNSLQINTNYTTWFNRMKEYGFVEKEDYASCFPNSESENHGGQNKMDHRLSINMAKQLCMIQRTGIGRQFRQYFIGVENAWNSPEKIMERAMQIAHQRAIEAERRIFGLLEENETLEIALNESLKYYTVAKYNREFRKKWSMTECKEIGKRLSAYCRIRNFEIRKCQTNDERFGSVNSYPLAVWNDFLGE